MAHDLRGRNKYGYSSLAATREISDNVDPNCGAIPGSGATLIATFTAVRTPNRSSTGTGERPSRADQPKGGSRCS